MTLRVAVVCEAEADFRTATERADRILLERVDWLDGQEDQLPYHRKWLFQTPRGHRLTWQAIKVHSRELGISPVGQFDGEPGHPDAFAARRAIEFCLQELPNLDAIVLVRDQDAQLDRRLGLEQARRGSPDIPIVIGRAVVKRECWVVSGFDPRDPHLAAEQARLDAESARLHFDPRFRSHDLAAVPFEADRSAKRVLASLSQGDADRERACWRHTPLPTLRERGADNGMVAFLEDVAGRLVPPLAGRRGS